jgi:muconate cycloisomerase
MSLIVDSVETFIVRVPTRADFRWNGLERTLGEVFVVRVTSGAIAGYGETVPLPDWGGPSGAPFGETPQIDELVIHDLVAPRVVGQDAVALGPTRERAAAAVIGYPYALGALDVALHDLVARSRGIPVYELLGGLHQAHIPIAHMIGLMAVDAAEEEARSAVAEGCRAFQIKGGQDPARDIALVGKLRDLVPDSVSLRLDANCGYGDAKRGAQIVNELAAAGVDMVEQPVGTLDALRRVTEASRVPIIADELCWSPADALAVTASRSADVLSIYVAKAGGLRGAGDVARIAAAAGVPHDLNGSLEAGIGNAASLHVAVSSAAQLLPSVIPINGPADDLPTQVFGRYFVDDVITAGMKLVDGAIVIGTGPGLGIDVDEEKLDALTVSRRFTDAHAAIAEEVGV